jgi:hypothetical protein
MGRGDTTGRARKVHPTAAQSLPPPQPLLLLLLIVRVSTRRNIDFTMKFAADDGVNEKKKNNKIRKSLEEHRTWPEYTS